MYTNFNYKPVKTKEVNTESFGVINQEITKPEKKKKVYNTINSEKYY